MRTKVFIYLLLLSVLPTYAGDNVGRGGLGGLDGVFAVLCIVGLVVFGIIFLVAKIGGNKDE